MHDPNEIVYCLACQKPMMAVDTACPACGADQTMMRLQQNPPQASVAGGPSAVLPAGSVRCPGCGAGMPLNASFCAFCGKGIQTSDPAAKRAARPFLILGVIFSVMAAAGAFPPLFGFGGAIMGAMANARNPRHWAGAALIGAAIACTLFGVMVYLVHASSDMLTQGLT